MVSNSILNKIVHYIVMTDEHSNNVTARSNVIPNRAGKDLQAYRG